MKIWFVGLGGQEELGMVHQRVTPLPCFSFLFFLFTIFQFFYEKNIFFFFFKYVSLSALVSECNCTPKSVLHVVSWRQKAGRLGLGGATSWERARFNSPERVGNSSSGKRSLPRLNLCGCCCVVCCVLCVCACVRGECCCCWWRINCVTSCPMWIPMHEMKKKRWFTQVRRTAPSTALNNWATKLRSPCQTEKFHNSNKHNVTAQFVWVLHVENSKVGGQGHPHNPSRTFGIHNVNSTSWSEDDKKCHRHKTRLQTTKK